MVGALHEEGQRFRVLGVDEVQERNCGGSTREALAIEEVHVGIGQSARRKAEGPFEERLQDRQIELEHGDRFLVEVVGSDDPLQVVPQGSEQVELLAEHLAFLVLDRVDKADVRSVVVEEAVIDGLAAGGDRPERHVADVPVDGSAQAVPLTTVIRRDVVPRPVGYVAGIPAEKHRIEAGTGNDFGVLPYGVVVVFLRPVAAQDQLERFGRGEHDGQRGGEDVAIVQVVPVEPVLAIAVGGILHQRDACGEHAIDQRPSAGNGCPHAVVVPEQQRGAELGFLTREPGDHVDVAARGVAAVQRALRPSQHLDALHVLQRRRLLAGRAHVDAIDEHRDTGLGHDGVDVRADAPHVDLRLAVRHVVHHAGRDGRDLSQVVDVPVFNDVGGQRGDRHRRLLQRALTFLGGDEDLFDKLFLGHGGAGQSTQSDHQPRQASAARPEMNGHSSLSIEVRKARSLPHVAGQCNGSVLLLQRKMKGNSLERPAARTSWFHVHSQWRVRLRLRSSLAPMLLPSVSGVAVSRAGPAPTPPRDRRCSCGRRRSCRRRRRSGTPPRPRAPGPRPTGGRPRAPRCRRSRPSS